MTEVQDTTRRHAMTANVLTATRIFLVLPIILLLWSGNFACQVIALALMIACEVSDGLDGYLARKNGEVSDFGKLFDPLADSIYRCSLFVSFAVFGWIPLWAALVFFWRDICVAYVRIFAGINKEALAARKSGKNKAVAQAFAIFGIVVIQMAESWRAELTGYIDTQSLHFTLGYGLLAIALGVTIWSLYDYAAYVWRRHGASG